MTDIPDTKAIRRVIDREAKSHGGIVESVASIALFSRLGSLLADALVRDEEEAMEKEYETAREAELAARQTTADAENRSRALGLRFDVPISDGRDTGYMLTARTRAALRDNGLVTVRDVCGLSYGELVRMPGMGPAARKQILGVLRGMGLDLGMSAEELAAAVRDAP